MPTVSPTLKGFMLGLLFTLVLIAGLLGSSYPLLQAFAVVLGGVLAGSYGYTVSQSKVLYRIRVEREFSSERAAEGFKIEVFLRVVNRSKHLIHRIEIEDLPPWRSRPESPPSFVSTLGPEEEKKFFYTIKPTFGRHRWSKVKVSIGDPLGLFRTERVIDLRSGISVTPSWSDLEEWIRREDLTGASGEISRRRKGFSLEFYEVREYQPGDDIRRVVWTATARTGTLMVREDLDEIRASLYLFIDLSSSSWIGPPGKTPADLMAKVSAGLLSLSARSGGVAGFTIFYGGNWTSFGPSRAGEVFDALLARLSVSSPEDSRERILLARALEDALRRSEGRVLILLLGPGALEGPSWDDLKKFLSEIKRGIVVIVLPWGNDEVSRTISFLEEKVFRVRSKDQEASGIRMTLVRSPFTAWEVIRSALSY